MTQNTKEHFYELLKGFDNAMLITQDQDHHLRARPMAIAAIEEDGHLWFATSIDSPKVDEITADSHVNVCLQGSSKFLSVSGRARIVRDRSKIEALWREAWKVWFPQGKETPDLALLDVQADEGEYWDSEGVNKLKFLFESVKAYATGTEPAYDRDLNQKVDLSSVRSYRDD